jgi:Polyketide cyclase / dehydrase and lipid transport
MAEYHFVSRWWIRAPIERVWEEIFHAERWPSWWKYVDRVDELEPGAADGVGRRQQLLFKTRHPYKVGFDVRATRVQPPSTLEADATGELEGTGRWTLIPDDGGTLVRYNWDVRTTRWWMNLLAPVARPAFRWNHDQLMREGGQSLARQLGAELELPDVASRRQRPARAARWAALAAMVALIVLAWRRRSSPRAAE